MSTPENPQDPYGQQPASGDSGAQGGYTAPQGGYSAPQGGYSAPQGGYEAPQGGYNAPPPAYGGGYAPANTQDNQLGIWALVLGIVSIVMCLGPLAGIPAIILGGKAKRAVAEGRANNESLGKIGVILGWIGTIAVTLFWILWFAVIGAAFMSGDVTTTY